MHFTLVIALILRFKSLNILDRFMKILQTSRSIVLFLVILVFSPNLVSAKDEWIQVRSKNFNLVGNASERDIRKVATKLEQFRETFRQLFKVNLDSAISTNVVVFKSEGAYKPFKPKRADGKTDNLVAGYFQPGEDVNYITLSTEGESADTYSTIFHEYVHFIVNSNFGKSEVPAWFNEGLAEYYSTFAIENDQNAKLGLPQSNHLTLLQQNRLIPLETLFKISNYALHQNGEHSRSIFYAESWALIHYLIQGGKTAGLGKFLEFSMKDVPAEKAFQDAFQISYAEMQKDLEKYVQKNTYQYVNVTFKNKLVFDGEMQTTPLSEADTDAYLGDLLYHTNRADDAEMYLQKTVALNPDLSMGNTTFGMIKMRQKKYEDAKHYFEKAISVDQKNHLAFYNYAFLLSREDRDEFGYVSAFPPEKTAKMRQLLKQAIAIKPSYTESYELLAFINLVNGEQLDESIAYLRKALQYQPGNQRYALRVAEIYGRQNKFAEAAAIADRIAKTTDDAQVKARAENLTQQLQQQQEILARNAASRKEYDAAVAEAAKNGAQPVLTRRRLPGKTLSPEEIAKASEIATMRSLNQSIRKPADGEKQVIGRIQKIECRGKTIVYTIKTETETFILGSKDFEHLTLMTFVPDSAATQVGCGANIADINAVLTYQPQTASKTENRGELVALDFVPKNFRFIDSSELQNDSQEIAASDDEVDSAAPNQNLEATRREAMLLAINKALRQPQPGEKRQLGLIEKSECSGKKMFFYLKTPAQTFKLFVASPQSMQIRAFTPEVEQLQFGCNLKEVAVPVIFTYLPGSDTKFNGELIALEFAPKSFVLD